MLFLRGFVCDDMDYLCSALVASRYPSLTKHAPIYELRATYTDFCF